MTKETQFGRMKIRNLPELLNVICDGSKMYYNRLVDIGNNRIEILKNAKSKYIVPGSNLTKDQVVVLGNRKFTVQSEKKSGKMVQL